MKGLRRKAGTIITAELLKRNQSICAMAIDRVIQIIASYKITGNATRQNTTIGSDDDVL